MSKVKKLACTVLVIFLISVIFVGCGSTTSSNQNTTAPAPAPALAAEPSSSSDAKPEPKTVKFWWLLGGAESDVMSKVVKMFNESQSKYVVEGTSVPDLEKTVTAMSSGDGPDIIWLFTSEIANYADKGLIENLDKYVKKDNFDLGQFTELSIKSTSYKGSLYSMPLNTTVISMFYNKDLLSAAGYTEPPKTMQELYDMSLKITKTDSKGDINVMGFPLFDPYAYQLEGVYAFGGRYMDDNGNLTPDHPGIIESLKMNVAYRKEYGNDAVNKFMATAATNVYTVGDIFMSGKQAFRFDGPWLCKMIESSAPSLNYGIAFIPGTDGKPETYGASRVESALLMMPFNAKEKDGAWEVMKFFATGDGAKTLDFGVGWVPAYKNLFTAPEIQQNKGFKEFIDQINLGRGTIFPMFSGASEYNTKIGEYFDYVYSGKMTPEAAMAELKEQVKNLKTK